MTPRHAKKVELFFIYVVICCLVYCIDVVQVLQQGLLFLLKLFLGVVYDRHQRSRRKIRLARKYLIVGLVNFCHKNCHRLDTSTGLFFYFNFNEEQLSSLKLNFRFIVLLHLREKLSKQTNGELF